MLPVRLELSNFKSHTHSIIDFNFTSALIIGEKSGDPRKSNGSGKSSLLESLSFALYGETGDKNADDIVKCGQVSCEVTLDFTHNEQKYQIKRTRNAKYSKMITEFWRITSDGQREKLHGDTNKITDSIICDTIKCTYDVFLNSVYFRQGSFSDFMQGTFSTRQTLLGALLNLEDWAKYQKLAKSKFDKVEGEVEALRAQLMQTEYAEGSLQEAKLELDKVNIQLNAFAADSSDLEKQISHLEEMLVSSSEDSRLALKFKELSLEQLKLSREVERLAALKESCNKTIAELNSSSISSSKAISDKREGISLIMKRLASVNLSVCKSDVCKMEELLADGKAKARQIKAQINTLESGGRCITCGHEWDNLPSKERETEIGKRRGELEAVNAKLPRAEEKLGLAKREIDELTSHTLTLERLQMQLDGLLDGVNTLSLRIAATEGQRSSVLEEILVAESKIGEVSREIGAIKDIRAIDSYTERNEQLATKKGELRTNQDSMRVLFIKSGQLTAQITSLQDVLLSRSSAMEKLNDRTNQAMIYSRLTKAFGRDGVQAIIIDNVVDELTRATNLWLSEFSSEPMRTSFVTQKQGTKGEWKETFDIEINTRNGPQPWHSLSGGEKFIVSFAIRLAIGSIQARRMGGETQLLLLDEVSSSLDPYNIDIFVSIIRKLERRMKVLVITHDPALKDEFEHIITVKKVQSGSEVEC